MGNLKRSLCVLVVGLSGSVACSSASSPTKVSGTIDAATFPERPTAIVARDEHGVATRQALDGRGAFSISLPRGHVYRLTVATLGGDVPFAFPRSSTRIEASFAVKTAGARVDLGRARRYASAPPAGFVVGAAGAPASGVAPKSETDAECANCVDDDDEVECDDGSHSSANHDGSGAEVVDGRGPLVVGQRNVPPQVTGCSESEEEDDDDEKEGKDHDD